MSCDFPLIKLVGTAFERGKTYGSAAADKVGVSIKMYSDLFRDFAGLQWEDAKKRAARFERDIQEYFPDALEEMRGIAAGAGVSYEDILALNCRSELMFALPDGCSTMALVPEATADGKTILAQTWDWLMGCRPGTVILEVCQPPRPTILTVSEAGMVGGKGLNSSGIGVCLNAMSVGRGQLGVPLHIMYRGILNSVTITDAIDAMILHKRAGAGTFTIGSGPAGIVACCEYTPDNFDILMSEGEILCHTNHYLSPLFLKEDTLKNTLADSFIRYNRLRRQAKALCGRLDVQNIWQVFRDHANYPDSICSHEDPKDAPTRRFCTVYGAAMDLNQKTLWVTNGNPCEGPAYPFHLLPQ